MRIATLRRSRTGERAPGVVGTARLDRRTKNLTKRLRPGDIAVIDHVDLDRVAAEALVACGVAAVVNVAPSVSGRYPNLGPEVLLSAGIPVLDDVGPDVFGQIREGDQVRVYEDTVYAADGTVVAKGQGQDAESLASAMAEARAGLALQLEAFAANTMEYLRRERELLLDGVGVPDIRTVLDGRHALVVVRGYDYRQDLAALRPYIREYRPVLIGVDGGADALRGFGLKPDIIVGDMDSVSDDTLRRGTAIVVQAHSSGSSPGRDTLVGCGIGYEEFVAEGTSEDVAMLLAYESGSQLIVAVGAHATMVEFLDKGRRGMASTFLTRLRLGPALVDAKGVSRLYEGRVRRRDIALLVGSAIVAIVVVSIVSEPIHVFLRGIELTLRDFWFSISDTF